MKSEEEKILYIYKRAKPDLNTKHDDINRVREREENEKSFPSGKPFLLKNLHKTLT